MCMYVMYTFRFLVGWLVGWLEEFLVKRNYVGSD